MGTKVPVQIRPPTPPPWMCMNHTSPFGRQKFESHLKSELFASLVPNVFGIHSTVPIGQLRTN